MMVGSIDFDSNWVDCHVISRIYLLFTRQLCSFLASSLHSWRRSMEKEVQDIQTLKKTGLAVSKQGHQEGRIESAGELGCVEGVEKCR